MDKSKIAISTYEKIADIYTKQYFNDLTDTPYIDKFLDKLPKNARVLDVGSGPGQFTKYMTDKGFNAMGIDFSDKMLTLAKKMVPNGHFDKADMRKLNFDDNSFDGLLVAYSLIHIPSEDIPETLQGFYRVVKNGGYIEIIAQKGEPDKIIDEPFMPTEKMFFNFFTKDRLTNFLETAGFKIEYQLEAASQDPDSASDKVIYTIAKKV
jgi:ubiquinone/menaquinone biosynthesis C-methylase UbiE